MKGRELAEKSGIGFVRRVVVLGSPGAGKSTLATSLGRTLGLPVIHLDAIYWKPGWVASSWAEFAARQRDLTQREGWIIDGNYSRCGLDERIERADVVLVLIVSRWVAIWRIVRRWLQYRGATRPDLGSERAERLNLEFLRWTWNWERNHPDFVADVRHRAGGKPVTVIRSQADARAFLDAAMNGMTQGRAPES